MEGQGGRSHLGWTTAVAKDSGGSSAEPAGPRPGTDPACPVQLRWASAGAAGDGNYL